MARQSTTPVQFGRTTRTDDNVTMTSGRAGKVVPLSYIPLLRGDSASGRVGIDIELAEMPRPLLNGVTANFQAWFVPKSADPRFSGYDEFMHSYQGEAITALNSPTRNPPPFFYEISESGSQVAANSDLFKTLGIHLPAGDKINRDLIDGFNQIYNFRLASHSSRLERRKYASEDINEATTLPRAFWPSSRFSRVVPDYERALVVGSLDLDVVAGSVPVGITRTGRDVLAVEEAGMQMDATSVSFTRSNGGADPTLKFDIAAGEQMFAELSGQSIGITLADIDKARLTQSFAKLRTAYAGNDTTGFDNDDAIVAELMQGFRVPESMFKRPWLLDSARVPFGMVQRHATDAANLDASVSQGRASATLSLNVPQNDVGGVIIITVEVLPERLDERQSDEWLHITDVMQLPDPLRDVQRPEPVDMVLTRRLDAKHSDPNALYGYEPMNDKWNRGTTRLGGAFYQDDPNAPWTEQRSAIWQSSIVDPEFTSDHFLAPEDFPHDVFSDTLAPAFEVVARHTLAIVGLTQIGDVLAENNDDYDAVKDHGVEDDA